VTHQILIDGHGSRFDKDFLIYINEPKTKWVVVLGLPYGTHVWQVGDAIEQNGAFKNGWRKGLELLHARQEELNLPQSMSRSDMIPLVKYAWERSFARVESTRKAIAKRGWNPLRPSSATEA
jgi:hypothetical protein